MNPKWLNMHGPNPQPAGSLRNGSAVIDFTLPILGKPKQSFKKGRTHGYTPEETDAHAKALAWYMGAHRPSVPLVGPVGLVAVFRWPWRKAEPKKNRDKGWMWKDTEPDPDNLLKQLADVLEGVGFVRNDSQIAWPTVRKLWTPQGGVDVRIWELA